MSSASEEEEEVYNIESILAELYDEEKGKMTYLSMSSREAS